MGNRERLTEFWREILKLRDLLGYLRVKWGKNIKMDLKDLVLEGMD